MQDNNVRPGSWQAWVLAARPKTLAGAAVPVMIGLSLAWSTWKNGSEFASGITMNSAILISVLCMFFAFVMQIDANFVNDYFDFMKGNDDETRLGPKRACSMGWISSRQMRRGICWTTIIAGFIGLPLVKYGGVEMIIIGVLCILFCFLYTTHLSYLGMGDVLVLLFFGIVPVCIPYYLITGMITLEVIVASIACGLVIDTLLMINNYRDIENDTRAGKRTLAVRLGGKRSRKAYLALGIVACGMGIVYALNNRVGAFVLPLVYLFFHIHTYKRMVEIDQGERLNAILGETARNMFIYGVTISIGLQIL